MNLEVELLLTRDKVFFVNIHENEILAHSHNGAK